MILLTGFFLTLNFIYCVYMMTAGSHATVHVWKSEDNFVKLTFSFYPYIPGVDLWLSGLYSKHICLLSHLISLTLMFLCFSPLLTFAYFCIPAFSYWVIFVLLGFFFLLFVLTYCSFLLPSITISIFSFLFFYLTSYFSSFFIFFISFIYYFYTYTK